MESANQLKRITRVIHRSATTLWPQVKWIILIILVLCGVLLENLEYWHPCWWDLDTQINAVREQTHSVMQTAIPNVTALPLQENAPDHIIKTSNNQRHLEERDNRPRCWFTSKLPRPYSEQASTGNGGTSLIHRGPTAQPKVPKGSTANVLVLDPTGHPERSSCPGPMVQSIFDDIRGTNTILGRWS